MTKNFLAFIFFVRLKNADKINEGKYATEKWYQFSMYASYTSGWFKKWTCFSIDNFAMVI